MKRRTAYDIVALVLLAMIAAATLLLVPPSMYLFENLGLDLRRLAEPDGVAAFREAVAEANDQGRATAPNSAIELDRVRVKFLPQSADSIAYVGKVIWITFGLAIAGAVAALLTLVFVRPRGRFTLLLDALVCVAAIASTISLGFMITGHRDVVVAFDHDASRLGQIEEREHVLRILDDAPDGIASAAIAIRQRVFAATVASMSRVVQWSQLAFLFAAAAMVIHGVLVIVRATREGTPKA